ncbi:hypothetical protein WA026_023723 [Henosepilachna vigintioctopunctata]|uniref:Reverse transcriptase domain-containing protein n=1 Tax=Henosepilachna vigintioctopunctata TaxID=420089 RepID=A0AAW1VDZ7_9CUCU
MYAADTNFISSSVDIGNFPLHWKEALHTFDDWCCLNGLILNESKTECIAFSHGRSHIMVPSERFKENRLSLHNSCGRNILFIYSSAKPAIISAANPQKLLNSVNPDRMQISKFVATWDDRAVVRKGRVRLACCQPASAEIPVNHDLSTIEVLFPVNVEFYTSSL